MRNRRREAVALARWQVVQTAEEQGVSGAARQHGVARSTVQRLVRRHRAGGLEALCTQPRGARPAIAQEVRELIVDLKLALPGRSSEKIRRLMCMSSAIVGHAQGYLPADLYVPAQVSRLAAPQKGIRALLQKGRPFLQHVRHRRVYVRAPQGSLGRTGQARVCRDRTGRGQTRRA